MKYQKHLSLAIMLTLVTAQTAMAASMNSGVSGMENWGSTLWNGYMTNDYGITGLNVNELTNVDTGADAIDEEGVANSDTYTVDTPTVHQGNLTLDNVGEINISDVLYVYGNMVVNNADSFVVTGKLRVTGKLTVNNGDLDAKGGKVYFAKKSFSNGSLKGKQRKVSTLLTKLDPLLRTDISDEEMVDLLKTASDVSKEYNGLIKELVTVRKAKGDTAGVSDKILQNRADFYNEIEQYIQEEDMAAFAKLEKADMVAVNRKIKITLGTSIR